jgi:hypothetical protein
VIRFDKPNHEDARGSASSLTPRVVKCAAVVFALMALLMRIAAPALGQDVGTVEGVVIDASSGEPIIEAGIEVIGQNKKVKTDLDGKYSIKLPPGSYELRVFAPLYQGTRLQNVIVKANEITRTDANLKPQGEAGVETVEVVAEAKKAAEATQILQRQKAATVSDNISAQQIQKSPDSKASEIVMRVPAVTIRNDKFIVVRGLGERYSSALLNGSRLASTDPNKRVVPLDLFPADFIDAITLIKTYTPDLPGDFAGGLLDITLREFPAQFTYSIGLNTSVNTAATFQDFGTYHACGGKDYFGFGADCRSLPGIFGNHQNPSTENPTTPQMRTYVGSLLNNWDIEQQTAPPNFGVNGSVGTTWGPFGFNIAAIYNNEYKVYRDEAVNSYANIDELKNPETATVVTYDQSTFDTQLGAILTTGYQLSPNHKFFGNAFVNRHSADVVLDGSGTYNANPERTTFSTNELYTIDQLGFGQLGGRHHWEPLDVDWRAAWAPSSEHTPDNKFLLYDIAPDAPPGVNPGLIFVSPSTIRTFGNLNEFLQDYNVDLTAPFKTRLPFTDVWSGLQAKFKSGAAYTYRDRKFDYRLFRTGNTSSTGELDLTLPPEQLLIPSNYGRAPDNPLTFAETTNRSDSFDATQEIAGGYGMVDLPLIQDRLRFVGGARVEYSYITTKGVSVDLQPANTILNNLDPLPGVNFIYTPRSDMNVRYSVSETVSRPEFRELTPTEFIVAIGQRSFLGNPNLVESHIISNDLRWEWFFTPLELASVSFFYKNLDKPIEIIQQSTTTSLIDFPINADTGTLWGFEFELRKNFGFLVDYASRWDWLKPVAAEFYNVSFLSNVSVVQSNATGLKAPGSPITNDNSPLVGQAPYTVNAALEYQNSTWGVWRLLYNTTGPTLLVAASDGKPEIDQLQRNQLDAVWITEFAPFGVPLTGKVAVENILNDRYEQTQGDRVVNRYLAGAKFTFGVSYTY